MPESIGSGAALFDFDNAGRLDIYLLQNGGPTSRSTNRLFHQGPDGRFTDVSAGSGLDVAGYGMGVAIGDVNNDGWPDVLITEYGRIRLLLNNGNGTFTDSTKEAGLDNPAWGTSACFADFNGDGWPDILVANDTKPNHLWINQRNGTFKEEAVARGIAYNAMGKAEANMGIAIGDVDGDGLFDVFVTHLTDETHTLWKQG